MIQILQSQTVPIIELVNPEGSYDILDTTTGVCATTALNAMVLCNRGCSDGDRYAYQRIL